MTYVVRINGSAFNNSRSFKEYYFPTKKDAEQFKMPYGSKAELYEKNYKKLEKKK
ncbi:hypothetical protein [Lactococcus allomyrinae]|uniref:hypothetical protein n=1 Tax=Lactococcus allomyrinae TaxID=2419773 RepID=UPI0013C45CD7|nr:hypothetical protein [Lactococcus allomyrinae]